MQDTRAGGGGEAAPVTCRGHRRTSVAPANAEAKLANAEAKGRQLRLRVSGTFVLLAWMLFVLAGGPNIGLFFGVDLTLIAGAPGFYFVAFPWAIALLGFSLRPTDNRAITFTCTFFFAIFLIVTGIVCIGVGLIPAVGGIGLILQLGAPFLGAWCTALVWPTLNVRLPQRRLPCRAKAVEARLAELTELARAEAEAKAKAEKVAAEEMAAPEKAAAAKKEAAEYARGGDEQNMEARKLTEAERVEMGILREMGLWVEMGLAPMPPRRKLKRLWRAFRLASFVVATTFLAVSIYYMVHDPFGDPLAIQGTAEFACLSASFLIASLVLTPANRGRVVAWLGALGKSDTAENEAAALAALVNNLSAAEAFKLGKKHFRKLPFSKLTPEDLPGTSKVLGGSSNGMSAAAQPTKELSDKTEKAILHEVDAFISHSWSDDGDAKYARMKEWAAGRDVSIWLDKACLDQRDINTSLAGLPVFLAGCKQLLVLAGPTYADRLWCVMEIFVFVRMGGNTKQDMDVRLLSSTDEGLLQQKLLKFDAGKAKTFDPNDRERLWAVIEAAFGTFDPFNKIVRARLADKLQRRDASGQSKRMIVKRSRIQPTALAQ